MSDVSKDAPEVGEVKHNFTPPIKQEHGAQVVLAGAARAAARGGLHGDIHSNTVARDAAVGRGEAADGLTPDASTLDGRLPPDVLTGADQPAYGPAGQGEGKKGFRPGDDKIAQAEMDAAAEREKARKEAEETARQG